MHKDRQFKLRRVWCGQTSIHACRLCNNVECVWSTINSSSLSIVIRIGATTTHGARFHLHSGLSTITIPPAIVLSRPIRCTVSRPRRVPPTRATISGRSRQAVVSRTAVPRGTLSLRKHALDYVQGQLINAYILDRTACFSSSKGYGRRCHRRRRSISRRYRVRRPGGMHCQQRSSSWPDRYSSSFRSVTDPVSYTPSYVIVQFDVSFRNSIYTVQSN